MKEGVLAIMHTAKSLVISLLAHIGLTKNQAGLIAYSSDHVDIKKKFVEVAEDCMTSKFIRSVTKLEVSVMDSLRGAAGQRQSVYAIVADKDVKASFDNREAPNSL